MRIQAMTAVIAIDLALYGSSTTVIATVFKNFLA